jgi:acetylornithine deacetylase/succinyl-diaminopimelate desuccinylase-like protein
MTLLRLCVWFLPLGAAGCAEAPPPPQEFDGIQALRYAEQQMAFGPRVPGTEGHRRMGAWLDSLARTKADSVMVQDWEHITSGGQKLPLRNVLMRFNPSATERLLFLAHWDTRPVADKSPNAEDRGKPVPGANDGASGVAVLLGMADALKKAPSTNVGVDLLFVDGEDFGSFEDTTESLLGARYYARNLPGGSKPRFAVLFDMVGDRDLLIYQEGNSLLGAPDVVEKVWDAAKLAGHAKIFVPQAGITVTDDHLPLQQVGIRAIDVIDFSYGSNNTLWHTPDDTIDKLSAQSLQAVGDVGMLVIRREK